MKTIRSIIIGLAVLTLAGKLQAQFSVQTFGGTQPAQPDSIVAITADAYGLTQMAPADLPLIGTYWLVSPNGGMVPLPCPPFDLTQPINLIANNVFLVDQTGGQVATSPRFLARSMAGAAVQTVESTVVAQGNAIANLIQQVQAAVVAAP